VVREDVAAHAGAHSTANALQHTAAVELHSYQCFTDRKVQLQQGGWVSQTIIFKRYPVAALRLLRLSGICAPPLGFTPKHTTSGLPDNASQPPALPNLTASSSCQYMQHHQHSKSSQISSPSPPHHTPPAWPAYRSCSGSAHLDVGAQAVTDVNALSAFELPRARGEGGRLAGQRTHRAQVNHIAG